MLDRAALNACCASLPCTSHVVQWGGSDVWKVGGKLFAVITDADDGHAAVTFKTSPMSFEMLKTQPGLRPAPYLASRGMLWIQHFASPGLSDDDLHAYILKSHELVAAGLSKKARLALGLT